MEGEVEGGGGRRRKAESVETVERLAGEGEVGVGECFGSVEADD